eukprot:1157337-Pelagomonas_calceolata.AAC.3
MKGWASKYCAAPRRCAAALRRCFRVYLGCSGGFRRMYLGFIASFKRNRISMGSFRKVNIKLTWNSQPGVRSEKTHPSRSVSSLVLRCLFAKGKALLSPSSCKEKNKGKGHVAVPAYKGSLAEAKKVPAGGDQLYVLTTGDKTLLAKPIDPLKATDPCTFKLS